jgi:hypothetical protein
MKKLLILLLLPVLSFGQNSWVRFQVQFDFYAPQESNFFMVSDGSGDTSMFFQPTNQYEYLDTVLGINSGNYTISLRDSYGDGWVSSQPASFKMGNACQGDIIDWSPVIGSFFQRDTTVTIYPCPPPAPPVCIPALLHVNLDQYQDETSWDIKDSSGIVIESGGPYSNMVDYQSFSVPLCLPIGPLNFTMYDTYGDGIAGSLWGGQDGSYYLTQCNDTIVHGGDANFGFDTTHVFASDSCPPVYGCMDPLYLQFNPLADTDDNSCVDLVVFGCTDSTMFNYDSLANRMALVPNCDYTLTLYDLMGDGWVGSHLRVIQGLDTNIFILTSGFSQDFTINLNAPEQVRFKFFITQQAQLTAAHCGFKLTNPLGNVIIEVPAPFIQPLFNYTTLTYCGNLCIDKVFGCLDPLAVNYDTLANTEDSTCYYVPGCMNSSYLEYYTQGFVADYDDGSCMVSAIWGCVDSLAFNWDSLANIDNGGCLPVILGCMQPLAFNFNALANTSDTCIAVVYGCMSSIAINYDSLANIDDGSCIGITYGCIDTSAFNYSITANVDDGSCIPVIYGCINPTQFNYDSTANTNDGTCIPYIYGCTDSTMFNYNPLANADNNSCAPYVFGCTDPSMLNYDPLSNTENFTCIEFLYGCMDSLALNYDSLANTENQSCIAIVNGCMDLNAYNYLVEANVGDSSCLYAASCSTGPGIPYWLNDPCYVWVIDVDNYCCENEWDEICQLTYNYCDGTYVGEVPARKAAIKKLVAITDLLGRPSLEGSNKLLFYIYDDGTVEKKIKLKQTIN